jgi:hypothetical protein
MSKKSVFCIATSRDRADRIVGQLKTANFSNNDISVLFPDKGTTRDFAHEKNTKAPEGPWPAPAPVVLGGRWVGSSGLAPWPFLSRAVHCRQADPRRAERRGHRRHSPASPAD